MASKNNNRQMVPEARQALDDMKFEIARELGVDVKGYGGDLTAREKRRNRRFDDQEAHRAGAASAFQQVSAIL